MDSTTAIARMDGDTIKLRRRALHLAEELRTRSKVAYLDENGALGKKHESDANIVSGLVSALDTLAAAALTPPASDASAVTEAQRREIADAWATMEIVCDEQTWQRMDDALRATGLHHEQQKDTPHAR